jgi:hypothetical protein
MQFCVELYALANAIKRPIWWKRLGNTFILQYSPSRVASSVLNVDQKWAAISLFNIAPTGSWTQDLLTLIPYRTICSSQCDQKTDLMEDTRQYIYTSIFWLPIIFRHPWVRLIDAFSIYLYHIKHRMDFSQKFIKIVCYYAVVPKKISPTLPTLFRNELSSTNKKCTHARVRVPLFPSFAFLAHCLVSPLLCLNQFHKHS